MSDHSDPFFDGRGGHFILPITPPTVTSQSGGKRISINKKTGKPMFFKNKAAAKASADYEELLSQFKPDAPSSGAIYMQTCFVFPFLKGEPKKNRKGLLWKTTKPDTDNMVKLLKDSMTAVGFWVDDSQVCSETVQKCHGETPRIEVTWIEMRTRLRDEGSDLVTVAPS